MVINCKADVLTNNVLDNGDIYDSILKDTIRINSPIQRSHLVFLDEGTEFDDFVYRDLRGKKVSYILDSLKQKHIMLDSAVFRQVQIESTGTYCEFYFFVSEDSIKCTRIYFPNYLFDLDSLGARVSSKKLYNRIKNETGCTYLSRNYYIDTSTIKTYWSLKGISCAIPSFSWKKALKKYNKQKQ